MLPSPLSRTLFSQPPTLAYQDAFDLAFRYRAQFLQQRKTPTVAKSRQRKNLHQRSKTPGIKVLLQKGDILYPIPSSDGHAISEDEVRAIRETATVLREGKRLSVAELLVAYKVFLEGGILEPCSLYYFSLIVISNKRCR